jgi:hypothetical protein
MNRVRPVLLALILPWIVMGFMNADNPTFTGTYTLDVAASDDIGESFEPAIREMNFMVRSVARSRVRQSIRAEERIVIRHENGHVLTQVDDRPALEAPVGRTVERQRDRGPLVVNTVVRDGALIQRMESDEGVRTNEYRLSDDGRRLTVDVTFTSGRLPIPVQYRLMYNRVPAGA